MKAISLWQPSAHLLATGEKRYETRSWKTEYRGLMALHAAKRWNFSMALKCYEEPFFSILSQQGIRFPAQCGRFSYPTFGFAFGAFIAVGNLVNVRPARELLDELGPQEKAFGCFEHGRWAWEYSDVLPLDVPMHFPAQQGIFEANLDVRRSIEEQLKGVTA